MFTTFIVQPIFNLLVFIYALIPGHDFGLAVIIFTVVIRLLMWPLVKKQLHNAKAMRELAPQIKKIKAATKGDRQKETMMTMELYKERNVNPLAGLGLLLVQIPILIGLFIGLQRLIKDSHEIVNFAYPFIQDLGWLKTLASDISQFDYSLFGAIDLHRTALGAQGVYWPAILLAAAASVMQYYQSRMLMPKPEDGRTLRAIMKEAGQGKTADQSEVSAAVGRSTLILIPAMVFVFSLTLAAALPLYWFVGAAVAYWQQKKILGQDAEEARAIADEPAPQVSVEAKPAKKKKPRRSSNRRGKKRRKR